MRIRIGGRTSVIYRFTSEETDDSLDVEILTHERTGRRAWKGAPNAGGSSGASFKIESCVTPQGINSNGARVKTLYDL